MHGTSESHGSAKRLPTKQMRTLDLHSGPHLRVECHRLCGLLAGLGSHGCTAAFRKP